MTIYNQQERPGAVRQTGQQVQDGFYRGLRQQSTEISGETFRCGQQQGFSLEVCDRGREGVLLRLFQKGTGDCCAIALDGSSALELCLWLRRSVCIRRLGRER
jgi:hypothetical protein